MVEERRVASKKGMSRKEKGAKEEIERGNT